MASEISSLPLTSFTFLATSSVIFASTALSIHKYVRTNGPIAFASKIMEVNNTCYSAVSLWLFFAILASGTLGSGNLLEGSYGSSDRLRYLYHISKLYEYQDIFNVLAVGGHVGLHFGVHHITTPYMTYVRVLHNHHPNWELFAGLNAIHHALMYAYFAGVTAHRPILDWTGCLQHVAGIVGEILIVREKMSEDISIWPNLAFSGLLGTYLVLTIRDIIHGKEGGKREKEIKRKKQEGKKSL